MMGGDSDFDFHMLTLNISSKNVSSTTSTGQDNKVWFHPYFIRSSANGLERIVRVEVSNVRSNITTDF